MIPRKIKIGAHWHKVIFPYNFTERSDVRGQIDHQLSEIRISEMDGEGNKRPAPRIRECVLHEILHGVDVLTGHYVFKEKEGALEAFSEALFQVLSENDLNWRSK